MFELNFCSDSPNSPLSEKKSLIKLVSNTKIRRSNKARGEDSVFLMFKNLKVILLWMKVLRFSMYFFFPKFEAWALPILISVDLRYRAFLEKQ